MSKFGDYPLINKLFYLSIILLPLWWIIGIKIIIFHILAIIMFFSAIYEKRSIKIETSVKYLLIFIGIYIFSIGFNFFDNPINRTVGSLYNLSFWIMGAIFIILLSNSYFNIKYIILLFKGLRIIGILNGVISIIGIILWIILRKEIIIPSPLLYIVSNSFKEDILILISSMSINFVRTDWLFNMPVPRVYGMFIYPTALSIGMAIIISFSIIYYSTINISLKRKSFEIVIMSIPLIFSFSRTVLFSIPVCILVVLIIKRFEWIKDKCTPIKALLSNSRRNLIITVICSLILLSTFMFLFTNLIEFILFSRKGSTDLRFLLYTEALKTTLQNPLIGIGIKYNIENIGVPVGSHSTYIGILLKTGLLGFTAFLVFHILIFKKWIIYRNYKMNKLTQNIWFVSGVAYLVTSLWMLTEDIDAPQIVALLYFLIVVIILNLRNFIENDNIND